MLNGQVYDVPEWKIFKIMSFLGRTSNGRDVPDQRPSSATSTPPPLPPNYSK